MLFFSQNMGGVGTPVVPSLYQAEPWGEPDIQGHFGLTLIRW